MRQRILSQLIAKSYISTSDVRRSARNFGSLSIKLAGKCEKWGTSINI